MSKTKIFITIIAIAAIGVVAMIIISSKTPTSLRISEETGGETADVQKNTPVETSSEVSAPDEVSAPETVVLEESKREAIKLTVDVENGFNPKTFTAKAGETIVIELNCLDTVGHVMQFRNKKIELVLIGGPKGSGEETDSTTYRIPSDISKGEYEFYDIMAEANNLPSLTGKMIIE